MGLSREQIPILEQFISVQGEGKNLGVPYYFIRVGGCPLRCNFCDSEYTWTLRPDSIKGVYDVADQVLQDLADNSLEWISITGGEPLLYPDQIKDMMVFWKRAADGRFKIHIETSGRFYDRDLHLMSDIYSVDAKTPCTGEQMDGYLLGIDNLRKEDQVKCLIMDNNDLDYAHELNVALDGRCTMVLQPFNMMIATESTDNMTEEQKKEVFRRTPAQLTMRTVLCAAYQGLLDWFNERCSRGELWQNVMLAPQVHVLAHGNTPNT